MISDRTADPMLTAAAALLLQVVPAPPADTVPRPPRDTVRFGRLAELADNAFDAPGTGTLVARVIEAGSEVPAELRDYRAELRSAVYLSVRSDSAGGSETPVAIDEFAGEVLWDRSGSVLQRVTGHRVRQLAPAPYTIGSMLESPWVVPHLYGSTIEVFSIAPTPEGRRRVARAVHPFALNGPAFYRYEAGDTVRVRTQEGLVRLLPVRVRPRDDAPETDRRLVAGTFFVDVDRAAITRARFGFWEGTDRFSLTTAQLFFELESGLVDDRFWLPYRQRREIQVGSPLFAGALAVRLVTGLSGFRVNTGWESEESGRSRLVRVDAEGDPFEDWSRAIGEEVGDLDIGDFDDLRETVRPPAEGGPVRVALRWERGDHLFRYNRVEGAFLGAGVRVEPREREERDWSLYATGGWAFAEETARGEVEARWHPVPADPEAEPAGWSASAAAYRRLRDAQVFRPAARWELGSALNAALGGYDVRDWYAVQGGEAFAHWRRGGLTVSLGGRLEEQDSASLNTESFLFGDAPEFAPVPTADPGTHGALEGEVRYARGGGAFGILDRGVTASLRGEAGLADFRYARATALLSLRRGGEWISTVARIDAGHVFGEAPPQALFRFGGDQGLRGYDRNRFGGSSAVIARSRFLLHLPPRRSEPLFRVGFFAAPPLRPAVVLLGEAGWSEVSDDNLVALARLGPEPTDGWEASWGVGLSLFDDAVSAEWVRPADGGDGRWYVGFVQWF